MSRREVRWLVAGILLLGVGLTVGEAGQRSSVASDGTLIERVVEGDTQLHRNPYPFTAYQIDQTCIVVNEQSGSMVAVPVEAMESCQLYTPEPSHVR